MHKVSSHIEDKGVEAVMGGFAELVDIIGNALADEAADLAAKHLRPPQPAIDEAKRIDNIAFLACIRLGFIQARRWDLFNGAPVYETPSEDTVAPRTFDQALVNLIARIKQSGHVLEKAIVGKNIGLRCSRCPNFRCDNDFDFWYTTCVPKATSRQLQQHQQKRRARMEKEKMNELIKKAKTEDLEREATFTVYSQAEKAVTADDDEDAEEANLGRPVKRSKQTKGGFDFPISRIS